MEYNIGPVGIAFVLIGIALLIFGYAKTYHLVYFSAPFFDLNVINIYGTRITPFYIFSLILIVRHLIFRVAFGRNFILKKIENLCLLGFMLSIIFSLAMAAFYSGRIYVVSMNTEYVDYGKTVPLSLSIANFRQICYPFFMIFTFFAIRNAIKTRENIHTALRQLLLGTIIVVISGIVIQLCFYLFGDKFLEITAFLMHGNTDYFDILARIEGYNAFGDFPRMYSFAGEPSFTASLLVLINAMYLSLYIWSRPSLSPNYKSPQILGVIIILNISLLLTGSTTAYIGMVITIGVIFLFQTFSQTSLITFLLRSTVIFFPIIILGYLIVLLITPEGFSPINYVINNHLEKLTLQEGSGIIRWLTVVESMKIFTESPIFGVGYGNHRSAALITSLLSNIGLVGTFMFIVFNISLLIKSKSFLRRTILDKSDRVIILSMCVGLLVWLPLSMVATPIVALIFGWYWLVAALLSKILEASLIENRFC